ncbi:MAG TPA: nitroreductase family protein [Bacillota bacterium]|nr:nitroreductase family protein [Bacillota bacterium]
MVGSATLEKVTDLKEVFELRRSVNFFDPNRELTDEKLKAIIDLAVLAPSAYNLQPWRIIAVRSEQAKERLFKLSFEQPKVKEASVTLIIIGDKNGYAKTNPSWQALLAAMGGNNEALEGAQNGAYHLYGTSEERRIKFAESNAGLLAMAIMYAAKYYGVDSHPMSGLDFDGIRKEFKLSDDENVVMTIGLGYFDQDKSLYPRGPRRGYQEIVTEV